MKIYVSDKEIDNNGLNYVEDDFVEEYWLSRGISQGKSFEVFDDVGLVEIKSLEQHDRELLREFVEDLNDWAREVALRHLGSGGSIQYNILYDKLSMLLKERGVE